MPETPLSEADPKSIDDLYSDDPLNLTNTDLDAMVDDMIKNRHLWLKAEAEGKATGTRAKKVYKEAPKKGQLSLDNLNILMPGKEE